MAHFQDVGVLHGLDAKSHGVVERWEEKNPNVLQFKATWGEVLV